MGIRVGIDIKDKNGKVMFTLHRNQLKTLYPNGRLHYIQCYQSCSAMIGNYQEVRDFMYGRKSKWK